MELIDRQETKELFCQQCDVITGIREQICKDSGCWIIKQINELPTIEAVPVRHGEWKEWDEDTWSCSVCGNPFVLIDGTPSDNEMNYCPKCGAKMEVQK